MMYCHRCLLASLHAAIITVFTSCSFYDQQSSEDPHSKDTIAPVISIERPVDTAYLYTNYNPQDVRVMDLSAGQLRCSESSVQVSGELNLNLAGVYYLYYDVSDYSGNAATTVTRTVHVVENRTAFLNGRYDVVCTCTLINADSRKQSVSSTTYQAEVSSEPVNGCFKIISLNIGKDHVAVSTFLSDSVFDAGFFNPDYHLRSRGSGTLSPFGFTIESAAYHYSGTNYFCKNVYRQKLVRL